MLSTVSRTRIAVALIGFTVSVAASAATTVSVVTDFPPGADGSAPRGALPVAGLTEQPDGSGVLYGTTSRGGSYGANGYGGGVAFKLTPPEAGKSAWTETVLHTFSGLADGIFPGNGNLLVRAGDVYGTTVGDVSFGNCGAQQNLSCDTVFRLSPPSKGKTAWTYTTLHRFNGGGEGIEPQGGLIADAAGTLYGTTAAGGNSGCSGSYTNMYGTTGCGAVYKLTPPAKGKTAWTMSVLHIFSGGADGGIPLAGLVADPSGSGVLYGTASTGGGACAFSADDCGVVFKLTPPAKGKTVWTETVLYSFKGGGDGLAPTAPLVFHDGDLYGTALSGGYGCDIYGCGTVFELARPAAGKTAWTFKVLHAFTGGVDGGVPQAAVTVDSAGRVYGTTFQFGSSNDCGRFVGCGTVFKLTPPAAGKSTWVEDRLFQFNGGARGGQSSASLALHDGVLFGTAALGGSSACPAGIAPTCGGVVFKITP